MVSDNQDRGRATLKTLLASANKKQKDIIDRLNVSKGAVFKWVSGESIPDLPNFVALARELNVPLKVLADAFGVETIGVPDDVMKSETPPGSADPQTWNLVQLERATGISASRLEQIQSKKEKPTGEELIRLGQALHLEPVELVISLYLPISIDT